MAFLKGNYFQMNIFKAALKILVLSVLIFISMNTFRLIHISAKEDLLPFSVGETIFYDIKKLKVKAGEAKLCCEGARELDETRNGLRRRPRRS